MASDQQLKISINHAEAVQLSADLKPEVAPAPRVNDEVQRRKR